MVVNRRRFLTLVATAGVGAMTASCANASRAGRSLTIGLTYVPNVQFAPFYLATHRGYFDAAGAEVTLRHHGQSEDLFGALAAGREQLVVAGGDEMMQARAQGIDVVSVATLYQSYPVVLIVPENSEISAPVHLAGRRIGIPGRFGETYFGLLVMLRNVGLTEGDVEIVAVGYTQQAAMSGGHVDAVMGFVNNDVPQFQSAGLSVRAISIGDVPLIGTSLGVAGDLTRRDGVALRGITTAVGRAIADIRRNLDVAIQAAVTEVPGAVTAEQRAIMQTVVEATVSLYSDSEPWGKQEPAQWQAMAEAMLELRLIDSMVPPGDAHTNNFIPAT